MLYKYRSPHIVEIGRVKSEFKLRDRFDERMVTEHVEEERELLSDVIASVRESDVFVDIGANIGLFSCLIGKKVDRVIAFEPHPDNYSRLQENVERNSIECDAHQIALSDTEEDLEFILPPADSATGGAAILSENEKQKEHFREQHGGFEISSVTTSTGDTTLLKYDLPSPIVLKVDVEGAEMNVLNGLKSTIEERNIRLIYVEVHRFIDEFGFDQNDVGEFLKKRGFENKIIHEYANGNYFLRAER